VQNILNSNIRFLLKKLKQLPMQQSEKSAFYSEKKKKTLNYLSDCPWVLVGFGRDVFITHWSSV